MHDSMISENTPAKHEICRGPVAVYPGRQDKLQLPPLGVDDGQVLEVIPIGRSI